jgi:hypothetical protein
MFRVRRYPYRGDVMAFVVAWPEDSAKLLRVSILDVQAFKDHMGKHSGAPKTINRRISSISSFYKFLSGAAAELRLPITVSWWTLRRLMKTPRVRACGFSAMLGQRKNSMY